MSAMVDSHFLRVASSIQSTLRPFLPAEQNLNVPQPIPSFDQHAGPPPTQLDSSELAKRFAPFGLPEETVKQLVSVISTERSHYYRVAEFLRHKLLEDLGPVTVGLNPSELPSLVEAAFGAWYSGTLDQDVELVQKYVQELNLQQDSEHEDSLDSAGESESDDDDENVEENQDEEDENSPMKPGEEVPPLDTKFLPIFEALHERGKVLTKPEKTYLVNMTGMTYRQITIWFQNRRRGELKEDTTMRTSSLRDGSVHSLDSSEASEDEADIEQRLNSATDTTFNIRSWRLTSALATKDGHGISLPPSPTKLAFGPQVAVPGYDTDDTDLSDSDDEINAPPGLRVPSLTGSVATLDSTTTRSVNASQVSKSLGEPVIAGETSPRAGATPRLVKSLPLSRRNSPPAPSQPAQPQVPAFNFNFTGATPTPPLQQFSNAPAPASAPPSQFVTSNERGLAVEMGATSPLSASTLRSASPTAPPAPRFSTPPAPVTASSPSNSGSRQNSTSPSPPSSSPRPAVKPLPRRTGCAPRPRPPPRATPASAAPTSSARPSIVLPPASNPSLAATTLGALLRPPVAPPAISTDMQERLSAMAGRMGVGSGSGPVGRNGSIGTHPLNGPSPSTMVPQTSSFSFGSPSLPKTGSSGSAPAPISEQHTLAFTGGSPMSS